MLFWKFNNGIEKDLFFAVNHFYKLMLSHNIPYFNFKLYGFNALDIEIVKVLSDYEARLLDEYPYTPHYLEGSEYENWKIEQENKKNNGFITNFIITWKTDMETKNLLIDIVVYIIEFLKLKRQNEINWLQFQYKGRFFSLDYDEDEGFTIEELKELI